MQGKEQEEVKCAHEKKKGNLKEKKVQRSK
jgi:hypothetical protein